MPSAADDIVSDIMARWADSLQQIRSGSAGVALFEERAASSARTRRCIAAVTASRPISTALPRWNSRAVRFTRCQRPRRSVLISINVAAIASFVVDGAPKLSVKITWVIVREDGDWKIVSHHVSSRAPLI